MAHAGGRRPHVAGALVEVQQSPFVASTAAYKNPERYADPLERVKSGPQEDGSRDEKSQDAGDYRANGVQRFGRK